MNLENKPQQRCLTMSITPPTSANLGLKKPQTNNMLSSDSGKAKDTHQAKSPFGLTGFKCQYHYPYNGTINPELSDSHSTDSNNFRHYLLCILVIIIAKYQVHQCLLG